MAPGDYDNLIPEADTVTHGRERSPRRAYGASKALEVQ